MKKFALKFIIKRKIKEKEIVFLLRYQPKFNDQIMAVCQLPLRNLCSL